MALVIAGQTFERRDIILRGRDTHLTCISETHRSYDALQYPLMFCHGEDDYSINIPQVNPNTKVPLRKSVSACFFHAYLLVERGLENLIFLYRSLLNHFLIDQCAKAETEKLNFL